MPIIRGTPSSPTPHCERLTSAGYITMSSPSERGLLICTSMSMEAVLRIADIQDKTRSVTCARSIGQNFAFRGIDQQHHRADQRYTQELIRDGQDWRKCKHSLSSQVMLLFATSHPRHAIFGARTDIQLPRSEIMKQIGNLFILRININLVGSILDSPEFFW